MAAGALALVGAHSWSSPRTDSSALDQFWGPIWSSSDNVLICVGGMEGAQHGAVSASGESVPLSEVAAMADILGRKKVGSKGFQVRSSDKVDFADLMKGPTVLIGGFDNSGPCACSTNCTCAFTWSARAPSRGSATARTPVRGLGWWTRAPNSARDYAVISQGLEPGYGKRDGQRRRFVLFWNRRRGRIPVGTALPGCGRLPQRGGPGRTRTCRS